MLTVKTPDVGAIRRPGPVYRPPPEPWVERVRPLLRGRDLLFRCLAVGKLVLGIALTFVAPVAVAGAVHAAAVRGGADWPYPAVLLLTGIVLVPLLYAFEHRTRGRFFEDEARALHADHGPLTPGGPATSSYGEWQYRGDRASCALVVEVFLFAPRLVFSAAEDLGTIRRLAPAGDRAPAEVVALLYAANQSLPARVLRPPAESREAFALTLAYLRAHEWIDVSKSGRRIWLLTQAREHLARRLASPLI